jgi:cytidylate kinase
MPKKIKEVEDQDVDQDEKPAKQAKKEPEKKDKKKSKKMAIAFKEFDPGKYVEINPVTEAVKKNEIVISFGRMNPITIGHEKVADKVLSIAKKTGAEAGIYLSHSQDAKKNPLSYDQKIKYGQAAFGKIVKKSKSKTIIQVAQELQNSFKNLTIVVGSDRVKEFETLLNKYNGKDYTYDAINVVSAGERDPDAEGAEGMSASKMRKAAADGDFDSFKKGLPKKLQRKAQEVWDAVTGAMNEEVELDEAKSATGYDLYHKTYSDAMQHAYAHAKKKHGVTVSSDEIDSKVAMGPKKPSTGKTVSHILGTNKKKNLHVQVYNTGKSYELNMYVEGVEESEVEEALNPAQRRARGIQMKKLSKKIARKKKQTMKKQASTEKLKGRAEKAARNILKKKISAGKDTDDLSYAQRQKIDDKVKKIGGAKLKTLAKKLLPQIKAKEKERIKKLRSKKEEFVDETIDLKEALDSYMEGGMLDEARHAPVRIMARPHRLLSADNKVKIDMRFSQYRKWKPIVEPAPSTDQVDSPEPELDEEDPCWDGYQQVGMKKKNGKKVPNCVPEEFEENLNPRQIALLKKNYSTIDRIDPNGPAYKKAKGMIAGLEKDNLIDLAKSKVKFISQMAADELRKTHNVKLKASEYMESVDLEEIEEGVNDPAIFKAIFLAGGPGSGKSFIAGKSAFSTFGMRVVNSDDAFESAMKKAGLDLGKDIFTDKGQEIRSKAVDITKMRQDLYIKGRLGLVIDGTGKEYDKIKNQATELKKLGYDVSMVFVNTSLETAQERNQNRDRKLPEKQVEKMWKEVQKNIGKYQSLFKKDFIVVDNSEGVNWEKGVMKAYKWAMKWSKKEPQSSTAQKWISDMREELEESTFEGSVIDSVVPWLGRWLDTRVKKKAYTAAIRYFLKLRKKKPGEARKNLVKSAQVFDLDVRALDKMFRDLVAKGAMPKHLIQYHPTFKPESYDNEAGAGEEGSDKLVNNYKSDTPGE